jgi:hypothetical protein
VQLLLIDDQEALIGSANINDRRYLSLCVRACVRACGELNRNR